MSIDILSLLQGLSTTEDSIIQIKDSRSEDDSEDKASGVFQQILEEETQQNIDPTVVPQTVTNIEQIPHKVENNNANEHNNINAIENVLKTDTDLQKGSAEKQIETNSDIPYTITSAIKEDVDTQIKLEDIQSKKGNIEIGDTTTTDHDYARNNKIVIPNNIKLHAETTSDSTNADLTLASKEEVQSDDNHYSMARNHDEHTIYNSDKDVIKYYKKEHTADKEERGSKQNNNPELLVRSISTPKDIAPRVDEKTLVEHQDMSNVHSRINDNSTLNKEQSKEVEQNPLITSDTIDDNNNVPPANWERSKAPFESEHLAEPRKVSSSDTALVQRNKHNINHHSNVHTILSLNEVKEYQSSQLLIRDSDSKITSSPKDHPENIALAQIDQEHFEKEADFIVQKSFTAHKLFRHFNEIITPQKPLVSGHNDRYLDDIRKQVEQQKQNPEIVRSSQQKDLILDGVQSKEEAGHIIQKMHMHNAPDLLKHNIPKIEHHQQNTTLDDNGSLIYKGNSGEGNVLQETKDEGMQRLNPSGELLNIVKQDLSQSINKSHNNILQDNIQPTDTILTKYTQNIAVSAYHKQQSIATNIAIPNIHNQIRVHVGQMKNGETSEIVIQPAKLGLSARIETAEEVTKVTIFFHDLKNRDAAKQLLESLKTIETGNNALALDMQMGGSASHSTSNRWDTYKEFVNNTGFSNDDTIEKESKNNNADSADGYILNIKV